MINTFFNFSITNLYNFWNNVIINPILQMWILKICNFIVLINIYN